MTEMREIPNHDFIMEKRLLHLNPELHRCFTASVFCLQHLLTNYKLLFPQFTDHTSLHSLTVIDFCNQLIGDQIDRLNADELYVLLMSCYFHDIGMGITMNDYKEFSKNIPFGDYFETHSPEDYLSVIRSFHHEYSGQYIHKYGKYFDIPSPEHEKAIIQVSRGHRKTDLMDEREYPADAPVPGGNRLCLPYLASLIRLADEIDVAAARNPILLYDLEALTEENNIIENKKAKAIHWLLVSESTFTLQAKSDELIVQERIRQLVVKMQETLDYCRKVVAERTPFTITQEKVLLEVLE